LSDICDTGPSMKRVGSFFQSRQKLLFLAASLYVVLLMASHWQLPKAHVWTIAAVFSVAMNVVYITEAFHRREFVTMEGSVALTLIVASVMGAIHSPLFVIGAIFAHGVWDVAKHYGAGVSFLSWYTFGCFTVDTIYAAVLLIYWTT